VRKPLLPAIAAVLLALAGVLVGATVLNPAPETRTVTAPPAAAVPATTRVDTNATAPGTQAGTITAPAGDRAAVTASELGDHTDARDETPVGASRRALELGRQAQDRLAATDQLPIVTPDAAPQQRGCTTSLVRNYSTRRGVRPRLWVVHYTVSPNRPGIGDVNAVTNLFNRAAFAASSNYVIDREGHCRYIVRESDKAWTQAAANPFAISVEIINSGHEGSLISGAGLRKVGQVISDSARRWQIPLRAGAVAGCAPSRPGIVSHQMLGACGGGHVDVSPYALAPIIAAARAARTGATGTPVDRQTCARLNTWRRAGRPRSALAVNQRRRDALTHRHLRCTPTGPVRR
jgi:hypothetical protein